MGRIFTITPAQVASARLTITDLATCRHPCELSKADGVTFCSHPDHERDARGAQRVLDLLGLADPAALSRYTVDLPRVEPRPVKAKQTEPKVATEPRTCRVCLQTKGPEEFQWGRQVCRRCHSRQNNAAQERRRAAASAGRPAKRKGVPKRARTRPSEKHCCRCGEVKQASQFYRDSRNPDGLRSECRDCFNMARRAVA